MLYEESVCLFSCDGASLVGVLDVPAAPLHVGVVIVVGGPQYRVGSHRQFVLLSRALAEGGIACLRFDYRGMGDSEGPPVGFENTQADICAAIGALRQRVPAAREVVLWGLCDGATASVLAGANGQIAGLVLVNPWVRTEVGAAATALKHYYSRRFIERAFWRKLVSGKVRVGNSVSALMRAIATASKREPATASPRGASLVDRVGEGLSDYAGPVLVILSENDLTAAEFREAVRAGGSLESVMKRAQVCRVDLPGTDHTFSDATSRDRVAQITLQWLGDCFSTTHASATAAGRVASA